ncbi:CCN family member 3-like [Octopus bimaculoides]|uniref:CCN family member 3-like n=1 Tax=Octopus bimaculoides TaxID=37653 RepID=UPI0022E6E771|nr:CCN family member 3-like [Octopus bimaculoides]
MCEHLSYPNSIPISREQLVLIVFDISHITRICVGNINFILFSVYIVKNSVVWRESFSFSTVYFNTLTVDPVIPSKCVDKTNCHQFGIAICTAPDLQVWVQKTCPMYCHSCPTPSVPQNGACLVGSKIYKPGETWQESCSMTCVCEDGLRGIARCYDKCAQFANLPPNCQKVKLAGECCPKIKCDQGTIIDSGGSSNKSTGHSIQGCMYKGRYYPKDQVWTDGCDYSCKCINATQGIYECTER